MTDKTPPDQAGPLSPELRAAMLDGLKRWTELPDDVRNGERPWLMGWNAGYEFAQEQAAAITTPPPASNEHDELIAKFRQYSRTRGMLVDADRAFFAKAADALQALSVASPREVDAARYRWLRDHSCPPHNFYISVPDEFHGVRYSAGEVDAYIDAARTTVGDILNKGLGDALQARSGAPRGAEPQDASQAKPPATIATCIITNCRRRAPAGEPFCSEHR